MLNNHFRTGNRIGNKFEKKIRQAVFDLNKINALKF